MSARRIVIMAGGTGGHIFPGLAIAETMKARGWQVSWLGTAHGMENDLVPKAGVALDTIEFSGLRGKGLGHTVKGAVNFVLGRIRAGRILKQRQADVVIGMGGYVTVPGGLAAASQGRPLVLVNADASPLLSNKLLGKYARRVLFGFAGDFGPLADKAAVTGNPIRRDIANLPTPEARFAGRSGPLKVLVVGGSLGARVLNETVPAALSILAPDARPLVTHQSGKQNIDALKAAYDNLGVKAELLPFIDDMPRRLAEADLVICRAGAITVSELTAAGVPSVLVPLVLSTTSHQRGNAEYMASEKAAFYLPQTDLSPERLAQLLASLDRQQCLAMAQAAYRLGRRRAADDIADILEQLVQS